MQLQGKKGEKLSEVLHTWKRNGSQEKKQKSHYCKFLKLLPAVHDHHDVC